jgi:hypothetical protein
MMFENFLDKLFSISDRWTNKSVRNSITIHLNDKVGPIDRFLIYEKPLADFLTLTDFGEISGAGTGQDKSGEIAFCDIGVKLSSNKINDSILNDLIEKMESLQAPKGSKLIIETTGKEKLFGTKEGLGLYIPNTNFTDDSKEGSDINFLYTEILRLINNDPNVDRSWAGKDETALYFYGVSFEKMARNISEFVKSYPLTQNSRIVQIA